MNPGIAGLSPRGEHPDLLFRLRKQLAEWIERVNARTAYPVDPTAHLSLREWADLPTHHPTARE